MGGVLVQGERVWRASFWTSEPLLADFHRAKGPRRFSWLLRWIFSGHVTWRRKIFSFALISKTQRRAFLGYLYVLFWTLHVLWTSGVPMLAWCVVTCLRGSSRVVMELRRFLGFSQVVPLVPCMQQITAWASSVCH